MSDSASLDASEIEERLPSQCARMFFILCSEQRKSVACWLHWGKNQNSLQRPSECDKKMGSFSRGACLFKFWEELKTQRLDTGTKSRWNKLLHSEKTVQMHSFVWITRYVSFLGQVCSNLVWSLTAVLLTDIQKRKRKKKRKKNSDPIPKQTRRK